MMLLARVRSLVLAFAVLFLVAPAAHAAGGHGHSGGGGKSSGGRAKSTGDKPVHVKGYTKKNGTTVESHDRKAPGTLKAPKSHESSSSTPASTSSRSAILHASASSFHADRCENCDRDEHGTILRNGKAKKAFERATGYQHGRPGYVIDHIMPLACGGQDVPSNMQWQTKDEAKAKDKIERAGCR